MFHYHLTTYNPIEPEWMRDQKTGLPIESRKRFYTPALSDEFSKALRSLGFQLSPIQTDHILKQMSGGLYQRGAGMLDTEKEEKHPILPRAFLRFPNRPTRQLNKFFTERTLLQQNKNAGKLSGSDLLQLKRMNIFYNTQVRPIQTRIRRVQQDKTLKAMAEIDRLYGVLGTRFNRFFDPRGGGKQPFKRTIK